MILQITQNAHVTQENAYVTHITIRKLARAVAVDGVEGVLQFPAQNTKHE